MTREQLLKHLEETMRLLSEEVDLDVTDYARDHAYISIADALEYIDENYDPEYDCEV